jgi:hypothetical protein
MTNQVPSNMNRSLGKLRPQAKTKPKSPGSTGTIYIKRDLLDHLHKQLNQCDDNEVVAKIAGWVYEDAKGPYMTIELSAKQQRAESQDSGQYFDFR